MRKLFSLDFLYILLIAAEIAAIVFLCLFVPYCLPVAVAFAAGWAFTAVVACVMLARGGGPEMKLALAALMILLPVAGAVIYVIACAKHRPGGELKIRCAPQTSLAAAANAGCGTCLCGYDKAVYLDCGEKFFELLFKELENAKVSIYLEYFILSRGEIYDRLVSCLRRAKGRGAEIKIILDGVGCAFKIGRKQLRVLKELAEIKIFHRLSPLPRSRLNFRDHRKIAVIDGRVAFTGGINLADEYANLTKPFGYWKDTAVAIYGGAAEIFGAMFLSVFYGSYQTDAPPVAGDKACLPFCDNPPGKYFGENALEWLINGAKKEICAFTPYFCVGERISAALAFAAERGVKVKIILPHIPDKKYAYALSKACAAELACSGVEFYEYLPGFIHAKGLVCDGTAYIGSYNLDFRSFRLNYECGVIFGGEIAEAMRRDFYATLALSRPLEEAKCGKARKIWRLILKVFAPLV